MKYQPGIINNLIKDNKNGINNDKSQKLPLNRQICIDLLSY